MPESDLLREQTDDGIVVLTLNRPETMNAIGGGISAGIMAACRESKRDDSIRCIVITGTGRGFCSGADLSSGGPARREDGSGPSRGRSATVDKLGPGELILAMVAADVPIIGAINGVAAGAGFGLALSCDVRIASDQARMGTIFIKRGVATDYGTSYWLPRVVGLPRALEIAYSGDLMDAQKLLSLGLVNKVVPHDSLMEETIVYARMIASGPALGYAYTRRNLLRSFDNDLQRQLELEWTNQTELLGTQDAREGFGAFIERRPPRFTGH